jgi:serine protease SohB
MTDFWLQYGLFTLKSITILLIVIGFLMLFIGIIAAAKEAKAEKSVKLIIHKLNDHFDEYKEQILLSTMDEKAQKAYEKTKKKQQKTKDKDRAKDSDDKPNLFIVDFDGDIAANEVTTLREIVSALLLTAKPSDEVLVRLESGGGMVHSYGLAAAQLARLRDKEISLTIAIDKVAASGGYMMASVANKVLASPFAIIGSIGVVATIPNFHKILQKNDVDYEQFTAGKYKRTVTMFGENTPEAKEKVNEELEQVLVHFKSHIHQYRPQVDIDNVATGEHWHAMDAKEKALVDELITSDDYILDKIDSHQIFELEMKQKQSLLEKAGIQMSKLKSQLLHTL